MATSPLLERREFLLCFVGFISRLVTLQEKKINQNRIILIPVTSFLFFSLLTFEAAILITVCS